VSWRGHYLDGRTAARRAASFRVVGATLEIATEDGATRRWPISEIRQTQGTYAGEPVRLERDCETVIVPDVGILTTLRLRAPRRRSRFHDPRRRRLRVPLTVAAGLAAAGLAVAFYLWGIPAGAGVAARFVPTAWEARLGDGVFERLFDPEERCADPRRQAAIDAIVARLVGRRGTPYDLRVTVVDTPQVNALALPGGRIVVFRGLLEATESPEMLAGVLAHEIQHVVRRHATRAIIQHASTGLMVAAVAGDVSAMLAFALEGARVVTALRYSRRAEDEADAGGLAMLVDAEIDPWAMVAFYARVLEPMDRAPDEGILRHLSTHPPTRDRVAALTALARERGGGVRPLLPGHDWEDVKRICGAG